MSPRRLYGAMLTGMLLLALAAAFSATAASNTVTASELSETSQPITANDLKPAECSALSLSSTVTGSATFSGTVNNDLVLGSGGVDTASGDLGGDCVLGGGGNDALNGNDGDDVLIGGPGDDTIDGGAGTDTCYGGQGIDTFVNCETVFQD